MNRSRHAWKLKPRPASRGLTFLAVMVAVGLCGMATALASSGTVVKTVRSHGGRILGQQKGYTLYVFCAGAANNCKKGHSARKFPPMIAYHSPVAGRGIKQKKLGTKRVDGKKLVTYYGQPLYRFKGDKRPGQSKGEDRRQGNGAWFVVSQFGQPLPPSQY